MVMLDHDRNQGEVEYIKRISEAMRSIRNLNDGRESVMRTFSEIVGREVVGSVCYLEVEVAKGAVQRALVANVRRERATGPFWERKTEVEDGVAYLFENNSGQLLFSPKYKLDSTNTWISMYVPYENGGEMFMARVHMNEVQEDVDSLPNPFMGGQERFLFARQGVVKFSSGQEHRIRATMIDHLTIPELSVGVGEVSSMDLFRFEQQYRPEDGEASWVRVFADIWGVLEYSMLGLGND